MTKFNCMSIRVDFKYFIPYSLVLNDSQWRHVLINKLRDTDQQYVTLLTQFTRFLM